MVSIVIVPHHTDNNQIAISIEKLIMKITVKMFLTKKVSNSHFIFINIKIIIFKIIN